MSEPSEWLETRRPVRATTAERLERNRTHPRASVLVTVGRQRFESAAPGQWVRVIRRRNPAWLAGYWFAVIADANAPSCPFVLYRYPRSAPKGRVLSAVCKLCRAQLGKPLHGPGIVHEGADPQTWARTKRPRFTFDAKGGAFVRP